MAFLGHNELIQTMQFAGLKTLVLLCVVFTLRWRHNDHAGVSNLQPPGCLLNRLFRRKSKKTSKLRVTGLCAGNSPGTGEFSAQMASYAENVSIWWRHHDKSHYGYNIPQQLIPIRLSIYKYHDDVIKLKHLPPYWSFVRGIHWSPVASLTKASDAELWCVLKSAPEPTIELTIETPVIWDATALVMMPL